MSDRKNINANNQNHMESVEPAAIRYFRPWEDRTDQNAARHIQRPNAVSPPAANYLNYWPQPSVSPLPWWYRYIPSYFYGGIPVQTQPVPTTWSSRATGVSTHTASEPLPVCAPTMDTTVPQMPRRKRMRMAQDEEEEQLIKRVSQLSREQVEEIIPYRREMARTFASKERTPVEQRKRDKNTEACRLSRRRKKLMEMMKGLSFLI